MTQEPNLHAGFEAREYGRARLELGDNGRLILHLPDPTPAERKRLRDEGFTEQAGDEWWHSLRKVKVEGVGMRRLPRPAAQVEAICAALERFAKPAKSKPAAAVALGRHGFLTVARDSAGFRITHEHRFDDGVHGSIKRLGGRWNAGGWDVPAAHEAKLAGFLARHRKASADAVAAEAQKAAEEVKAAAAAVESAGIEPGEYGAARLRLAERGGVKGYRISFPYHAELVSQVKDGTSAKFDAGTKTWFVPGGNEDAVRAFLRNAEKVGAEMEAERERVAAHRKQERQERERVAAHRKQEREAAYAKQRAEKPRRLYPVSELPLVGQRLRMGDQIMVVTGHGKPFTIDEDAPSMHGSHLLGHEGEAGAYAYMRVATPAEVEEAERAAARAKQQRLAEEAARATVRQAARLAMERGTRPDPADGEQQVVDGERLLDTQTLYGGGDWWVIQPDRIWYIRNNGADGDDWRANNVRTGGAGAIGWYVSYTEGLARTLRSGGAVALEPNAIRERTQDMAQAKAALTHYVHLLHELQHGDGVVLLDSARLRDAWRMRTENAMPEPVSRIFDQARAHQGDMPTGWVATLPEPTAVAAELGLDLDDPVHKPLRRLLDI